MISDTSTKRALVKGNNFPQLVKLWKLFASTKGRDPTDVDELERWLFTPEGQTALTPLLGKDGKVIADRRKFNGDASRFAGRSK
jgi:hypothetical protein